jgi:glycosyltransferase involved in cell wall biosynthesis
VAVVHAVVPEGIDDPARPSGGNVYDRRVLDDLGALGWTVREHPVAGRWPDAGPEEESRVRALLSGLDAGSVVLLDGLVASAVPAIVSSCSDRLRVVVLVHLPLGVESPDRRTPEASMLAGSAAVLCTSEWCRGWLLEEYDLPADLVTAATPGTDRVTLVPGTPAGRELLCVGAVAPVKGQDVLVDALATVADMAWHCVCAGSVEVDAAFVSDVRDRVAAAGLGDRVEFLGALGRPAVEAAYAAADVLLVPSRAETYGIVVVEALAHGLPVIAAAVGGVPEALGRAPDGAIPGILAPPGDPSAFGDALRVWLTDAEARTAARHAAAARRATLAPWAATSAAVAGVLAKVGAR